MILSRLPIFLLSLAVCAGARAGSEASTTRVDARGSVEVAFAPQGNPEAALVRLIEGARHSVRMQAYLFTSRNLAKALLEANRRGVTVEVLADGEQTLRGENSQVPVLAAAGIPVRLEMRYAAAHNKIVLVDAGTAEGAVATGSFNFTYSARAKNAENLIILRGNPALVEAYFENWRRHSAEAIPYAEHPSVLNR